MIDIKSTDQMPSLKMKTKSTNVCLKEKNGLQICQKSSIISKSRISRAGVTENVEESTQSSLDDSVFDEVYAQDLERNEANPEDLPNETKQSPMRQLALTDSATVDSLSQEPTSSTSKSNTETVFPSIVDSVDFHSNEGSDEFYVPQLDSKDSDGSSRSSSQFPASNVSDFGTSDMMFSESNLLFRNETDTIFIPDYNWDDASLLCHMSEEDMVLPFLEDASDSVCESHQDPSSEETIAHADMAIHQFRSYKPDTKVNTYLDVDYECFDPELYMRNLLEQPDMSIDVLPTLMPDDKNNRKRSTLVLDLDETLVHSTLECCDHADFTFTFAFNTNEHTVYVKRRPHLETFLNRVADMFEIMVFTASESFYASPLLDILDPNGKLISRRAYRETCSVSEGTYVKDLTVLGLDLARVAIIDNTPQVFRLQVNNGIPIKSWFDDPSDCELISLLPFLETLEAADDVRPIIAKKFGDEK